MGERSRRRTRAAIAALLASATLTCGPADGDEVIEIPGAAHRFTEAAGVRWHWVEAGSGEPVLLLHGLPGTWHSWSGVIGSLASAYRVIAPDLKAFGHTSAPEGDYSFCGIGSEILALLDRLGIDRFRLVGHDWGAMIGACMASRSPQRVIAYAHVGAPLLRYDLSRLPDHRELVLAPQQAADFLRSPDVLVRRAYAAGVADPRGLDPAVIERRIADLRGRAEGVARYFRDMDLLAGWSMGPGMVPAWENMAMPVALIVGDRDLQVPLEVFLQAESLIPGALPLIILDDTGHFPAEEQPERLVAVLQEVLR